MLKCFSSATSVAVALATIQEFAAVLRCLSPSLAPVLLLFMKGILFELFCLSSHFSCLFYHLYYLVIPFCLDIAPAADVIKVNNYWAYLLMRGVWKQVELGWV